MSKYLHELCCCIIQDFYGEFYARIFYNLTHNGRFNANQMAQRCHLPIRHVRSGLAAMVQLRLIYHHTALEGASTYQANTKVTYDILRSGRLIDLAQGEYGDLAYTIMTEAALLGFSTIEELVNRVQAFTTDKNHKVSGNTDEIADTMISSSNIQSMIGHLIKDGFLSHVRSAHFQTEFDAGKDAEGRLSNLGLNPTAKGRKGQIEFEERISAEVHDRQSVQASEIGYTPLQSVNNKRSSEDNDQHSGKRQKMTNGDATSQVNGHKSKIGFSGISETDILISVSYGGLVSRIRDDRLARLATKSLGDRHSSVLISALRQVPTADPYSPPSMEHWLDTGLLRDALNEAVHNRRRDDKRRTNGVEHGDDFNDHDDTGSNDDIFSYGELDRSLALLSEGMFDFLQGGYSKDQWKISYNDLNLHVQKQEMLRIMGNRLGPPALRIVRMLIDKGKLDEKSLQETGLLGAKDLRQALAQLSQMGYVDLQEVPREAQRQPNRTIFLWFHDPERVRRVLLEGIYKAMTRLMQRLSVERKHLSSTLEKVDRSDVKGCEDQMLPPAELRVWRRWQKKEEWLLGEITRLDDAVAILRDL